jgi:hypothetical protein
VNPSMGAAGKTSVFFTLRKMPIQSGLLNELSVVHE